MKAYLSTLLGATTLMVLGAIAVSMIVDPYRIVHPLIGRFYLEPNSRVPKVKFLSHNCYQYDSYIVGDSRSVLLSERDFENVQGRRFYNFATPTDDIESIVRRLNFLIGKGCPISTVVVGESIDVLLDETGKKAYSLLLSEYPAVSGENRMEFYSKYFLSAQALITFARARHLNASPLDNYHFDGHADYLFGMEDGTAFTLPRCQGGALQASDRKLLFDRLPGYHELAKMSGRYHFKAIVWIAPLNKWKSRFFDDPIVKDYLQELRAIPNLPVVEADRNSPLLSDFHNWHDCGHFRRIVFDQLVAPAVSMFMDASEAQGVAGDAEARQRR
jgi:hypothetical protein